jgi:hypothetical protein
MMERKQEMKLAVSSGKRKGRIEKGLPHLRPCFHVLQKQ